MNEVMKPQSLDMLGNGEILIAVFFIWTNIESYEKERQLEIWRALLWASMETGMIWWESIDYGAVESHIYPLTGPIK